MTETLAFLGPQGTYSEQAALLYCHHCQGQGQAPLSLQAFPSILQAIAAVVEGEAARAIVPVENSIEGSVTVTLDALWEWPSLRIQEGLILPIGNALITRAPRFETIQTLYSHPQPLGQCRQWIKTHCPQATLVPTRSTAEALGHAQADVTAAAIASERAAQLYHLPILAPAINDQADNCTKFLVLGHADRGNGHYTSLAFSLPVNQPGALLKPLQIFSEAQINLSRIESRPTKRSLGEYRFFLELEAPLNASTTQTALAALIPHTETLRIFGSYDLIPMPPP